MSEATQGRPLRSGLILIALFCAILLLPRPENVKPEGWRLFAIFATTVAGLILQPIPGGALVLIAVTLSSMIGGLTILQALGGYGDPTVWLVQAAFFISTAMIKTGLARRIALFFVRTVGQSSLGVTYALAMTDLVLASIIPSNGARSGGVTLPIARSIAELYGSKPGPTAALLGGFLMTAVYQSICITTAMFITGHAGNPLLAQIAGSAFHYPITWVSWFVAALVPGVLSLLIVPYVVSRINPPEVQRTPEAAAFAASELKAMGPMDRAQGIVLAIFLSVCALWITSPWHGLDIAVPALLGSCGLLVMRILDWSDVVGDRTAWDIFIWYGGMLRLGKALNDAGVTTAFAAGVGSWFSWASWELLLVIAVAIYFYSHYGFASITAHILAMFTPFAAVLIAKGAPVGLVMFSFACFSSLAAGLTHYGTTPGPMFFATNYVSFKTWWSVGFVVSLVNIAIWSTVGAVWWKLLGLW